MSSEIRSDGRLVALFFVLTFALSWLVWVPAMLESFGWPGFTIPGYGLLGAVMPGIAALIVAGITSGRRGAGALWGQVKVWRVGAKWYGFAVLLRPLMVLGVFAGFSLWGGSPLPTTEFSLVALLVMLLIQTPNTLLEEIGWRGFALPRMAEKLGWLFAALLLSVIYASWHLPYWLSSPDIHEYGVLGVALWFTMVLVGTPLFVWLYRNTRSVLLCWLLHLGTNTTLAFVPLSSASMGSLWPLAVDILLVGALSAAACYSLARSDRGREPVQAVPTAGTLPVRLP